MKASSELHNLLEAAEYVGSSQDAKNHSFAKYGFEYYKTKFVVDRQTFEGIIDIGVSDKGATFYGMTNVKRTAYSGQPSEHRSDVTAESKVGGSVDDTSAAHTGDADATPIDSSRSDVSSDNSIPNSGENVKKKFTPRGRVDISANADTSVPATAGHEFTHSFKKNAPEAYERFENYVIDAAMKTDAGAVNRRMTALKNKFGYTDDVAREEIAAEFAESFLKDKSS
ncbi:MAG: hypothetical protein LIO59_07275, partial [Oscillospiraceae bacterium]|nr:hypothetical protein [Oscillospiraceae bacterium]